jgi:hypothetical protein
MPSMSIVEVLADIRFSRKERLLAHARKHVIDARGERWHSVLDAESIGAARDEIAAGRRDGPAVMELSATYQRCLASKIHALGVAGEGHMHMLRCELSENLEPTTIRSQDILAWDVDDAIWIVAGVSVRNGREAGSPFLRTGYRPFKRMPKRAFERRMRERVKERLRMRDRVALAWHDRNSAEGGES